MNKPLRFKQIKPHNFTKVVYKLIKFSFKKNIEQADKDNVNSNGRFLTEKEIEEMVIKDLPDFWQFLRETMPKKQR